MLNRIEGVSESNALPKQGGEAKMASSGEEPKKPVDEFGEYEQKQQPKSKDQKVNEDSGSKGKGKLIDVDDDEEKEDEGAKLQRKSHDKELDELNHVANEVEAHEKELHDAQVAHETQKALFPP